MSRKDDMPAALPVTALIQQDHDVLLSEAKAMAASASSSAASARAHYQNLKQMLALHARAEELIVYRALESLGQDKVREAAQEGMVEHALCDHLMLKLARGPSTTALWRARATVVYELLVHHLLEEQEQLLPLLSRHFDAAQLESLGRRYLARKQAMARA